MLNYMHICVICSMLLWHFLRNFIVMDFGIDIYFLSWILALTLSQVCFLILDLCLNIISCVLPCPEFWPWHCHKCASLSWILAWTMFWVLLPCPESLPWHSFKCASLSWIFALTLSQVCFLVLDLCLNIISNVLPCPGFWPWHCSEVYFLVLNLCFNIISNVLPYLGSLLWPCLKFASLS